VQQMGARSNKAILPMLATVCEPVTKDLQVVASMPQGAMAGVSRTLLESGAPEKQFDILRQELIFFGMRVPGSLFCAIIKPAGSNLGFIPALASLLAPWRALHFDIDVVSAADLKPQTPVQPKRASIHAIYRQPYRFAGGLSILENVLQHFSPDSAPLMFASDRNIQHRHLFPTLVHPQAPGRLVADYYHKVFRCRILLPIPGALCIELRPNKQLALCDTQR
jgi:hypothetical protein